MKTLINLILLNIIPLIYCGGYREVKTKYGKIIGRVNVINKKHITHFLGIPYAKPPLKNLRFKPPQPLKVPAWKTTFNASIKARSCMQYVQKTGLIGYDITIPTNKISEDCLQLNIFAPHKTNMPVIVFFHGGAYNFGSGSLLIHKGEFLSRKTNQIVVTVNYRLGIFGFAYLESGRAIPGNIGLLDQQMALKWVYENIAKFGGNPKKITIWGQSSGSASATAHLFAPNSTKYFSKVIANSGTILNSWATISDSFAENNTIAVVKLLKCKTKDYKKMVQCLQKAPAEKILQYSLQVKQDNQEPVFYSFAPVKVDNLFFRGNVLHKFARYDMNKDVDLWIGKTANEASYFMPSILRPTFSNCTLNPANMYDSLDKACQITDLEFKGFFYKSMSLYVKNQTQLKPLLDQYYKLNLKTPRAMLERFLSDILFDCDIIRFTHTYALLTKKNVFFYHFEKRSKLKAFPSWMGVYHGTELEYEFVWPLIQRSRYPKSFYSEHKYAHLTAKMFGRFNHHGRPAPLFRKYKPQYPVGSIYDDVLTYNGPKRFKKVKTATCSQIGELIDLFILNHSTVEDKKK
ncbi:Acetylcholinesterase [Strongyloides ratti]|uniref:Carboxylic ester hydrolase n=1 Tax=Strongyloides ratti TaxID=34506 RepID=A0A090LJ95_STRRB|nr:Acetylcholinesterase [Strongyloides ratti]CEF69907.1 Acetylcholinesterase [Strongyloides ratti]